MNDKKENSARCTVHPEIETTNQGCSICGISLRTNKAVETSEEYIDMILRFVMAVILLVPLLILNIGVHFFHSPMFAEFAVRSNYNLLQFLLATPVVLFSGFIIFKRAYIALKSLQLNMFSLIALGVGIAYIYSILIMIAPLFSILSEFEELDVYFESAAMITTLTLLGQVLELRAHSKATSAMKQLLALTPNVARLVKKGNLDEVIAISDVKVGYILRVRPGDRIPVDGIIIEGEGTIDQSSMTGESLAGEKGINDFVIGGTLNMTGSFIMRAEKVGSDTLISRIVETVKTAINSKAEVQKLADKVASYFIPIVLLIAIAAFCAWFVWGPEPKINLAILTSIAVLIIACPCALGLATPISIMVSSEKGAREGILIRDANTLEVYAKANVLVFDKTGTLTEGAHSIKKIIACHKDYKEDDLLYFASSVEKGSEHPIAGAILKASKQPISTNIKACKYIAGQGVAGTVDGKVIACGNDILMKALKVDIAAIKDKANKQYDLGYTVIFIAINNKIAGLISIGDTIKPEAKDVIHALKQMSLKVIMLTGDNYNIAQKIAKQLGIGEIKAEVLPQKKYEYIKSLQKQGLLVAMIGDGINDAPALAQADIAIAMGNGSNIALESAGINLLSGNLNGVLKAKTLSNITIKNIKQNLFLAFIYNILALPIAAGVLYPIFGIHLSPVIAGIAMTLSSVSVIFNAMRVGKKNSLISV